MHTIATPRTHSENEHAIVALLSGECLRQATALQRQLKNLFGDCLWLQEPPSLHITLMEIICDADYGGQSRRELFRQWHAQYGEVTKKLLARVPPFDLVFDQLLVSQRAIIIKTRHSDELNKIRALLLANIQLPHGTKNPPDITHATLARFNQPLDLAHVNQQVARLGIATTQHVAEFSLVKDLGPPTFNGTPLERYRLTGL